MKKYYSSAKEYNRIKRLKLVYRFLSVIGKIFFRYCKFLGWEKIEEPSIIAANHTQLQAPLATLFYYPRDARVWVNAEFITPKGMHDNLMRVALRDYRPKWFFHVITYLLSFPSHLFFKGAEGIPAYHDMRVKITFEKTNETLNEGKDVVIFPEKARSPMINKYLMTINEGFVYSAYHYYEATKKRLKFYPAYCCNDLKVFLIGDPIEYDPEIPMKAQRKIITDHIGNEIKKLADSLPPHKINLNKLKNTVV